MTADTLVEASGQHEDGRRFAAVPGSPDLGDQCVAAMSNGPSLLDHLHGLFTIRRTKNLGRRLKCGFDATPDLLQFTDDLAVGQIGRGNARKNRLAIRCKCASSQMQPLDPQGAPPRQVYRTTLLPLRHLDPDL